MLIEEASGLDHLEALQNHSSNKIYEMAFSIVEKYFQGEVCSNLYRIILYSKNYSFYYLS
jgi:hypothetical protein